MSKALVEKKHVNDVSALGLVDESQGGLSSEDFEIPRAKILQKTSPDTGTEAHLKCGVLINSITKEILNPKFVPLFAFKQYAEFENGGALLWSTMDRTDPRVVSGLEWGNSGDKDKDKPSVTEFINFMCAFEGEAMPLVLSFKRTSIKSAKRFLTLASIKAGPIYAYRYEIKIDSQKDGNNEWWVPTIGTPEKKVHVLKDAEIEEYGDMAKQFKGMVAKVKVEQPEEDFVEEAPF